MGETIVLSLLMVLPSVQVAVVLVVSNHCPTGIVYFIALKITVPLAVAYDVPVGVLDILAIQIAIIVSGTLHVAGRRLCLGPVQVCVPALRLDKCAVCVVVLDAVQVGVLLGYPTMFPRAS